MSTMSSHVSSNVTRRRHGAQPVAHTSPQQGASPLRGVLRPLVACLLFLLALTCCACTSREAQNQPDAQKKVSSDNYIVAIEDEPDTVDFQRTTIFYTIATNVFDRLVEMEADAHGNVTVTPSLAESWEESDDGLVYTFHLRDGVTFSNGEALTASDVLYTFKRLLTHPQSCNQDIAENILGASKLEAGETDELEGFEVLSDLEFSITLEEPFEAFLACLSMPGASIMDERSVELVGDDFGMNPQSTIGTGSFVLAEWKPGKGILLKANPTCWKGAPKSDGIDMRFITEPENIRSLFEEGKLDIIDLDDLGSAAEFFIHGDIYQNRIYQVPRIAITYIALNESVKPLDDVRVRKALQLALDRTTLLDAIYSGRGEVENGIFPHGLLGYNPSLPQIAHDAEQAKELLKEAGYADGLDLTYTLSSASSQWEAAMADLVASMWQEVGVRTTVEVLDDAEFMRLRKSGELSCYSAMWTADYDDPDNFIYTFFGNTSNTTYRSLCYPREDIMERVREARAITNTDDRLKEYQDLERIIVQEDAAWIPLFSRKRLYVTSERLEGFQYTWNGSVKNVYSKMGIKAAT